MVRYKVSDALREKVGGHAGVDDPPEAADCLSPLRQEPLQ